MNRYKKMKEFGNVNEMINKSILKNKRSSQNNSPPPDVSSAQAYLQQ